MFYISSGPSRSKNLPSSAGLDEYVDILQVQQLLLDSSTATGVSSTCTTTRPRPRLNVQKATEYSSQGEFYRFNWICYIISPHFSFAWLLSSSVLIACITPTILPPQPPPTITPWLQQQHLIYLRCYSLCTYIWFPCTNQLPIRRHVVSFLTTRVRISTGITIRRPVRIWSHFGSAPTAQVRPKTQNTKHNQTNSY